MWDWTLRTCLIGALILAAGAGRSVAQDGLFMLSTTVPAAADAWYQAHYGDTLGADIEWEFATIRLRPNLGAQILGRLSVAASRHPYLHFSWIYRGNGGDSTAVWREDVGDWGYGINQFVVDTLRDWVRLPPGPYGRIGWVRLAAHDEDDGFYGYLQTISGMLVNVEGVAAIDSETGEPDVVSGIMFIDSIEDGFVTFRSELPSDMACGEEVTADPAVPLYRARISAFLTEDLQPRFSIAYPKGC